MSPPHAYDYGRFLASLDQGLPGLVGSQIDDPGHADEGGFRGPDGLAGPNGVSAALRNPPTLPPTLIGPNGVAGADHDLPSSSDHHSAAFCLATDCFEGAARKEHTHRPLGKTHICPKALLELSEPSRGE